MTKFGSTHGEQSEKAIIDALLRISEIVQKTEAGRQYHKSTSTNKRSKKTMGEGDYSDGNEQQEVPVPPPMRTLESYVSGFNQNSSQNPSNCNRGSGKQHPVGNEHEVHKHSCKRYCSDRSFQLAPSSNQTSLRADQDLQATLEAYLRKHFLSPTKIINEKIQKQRQIRFSSSDTDRLIHQIPLSQPIRYLDHYHKQRETAALAAQQGNYALSYSIYTNLLHDDRYDHQLKSDILASRATILLFEQKHFEAIDDCTRAIAFNQWNQLAYVVRAACWMINEEYAKAVEDYSKLFHFFERHQHILDLLNLAYEKQSILSQSVVRNSNDTKASGIDHRSRANGEQEEDEGDTF